MFEFRSATFGDQQWRLADLLSEARYDRDGNELEARGLYVDMAPWRYHVFRLEKLS